MGGLSITGPLQGLMGSGTFRIESQIKAEENGLAGGSFWRDGGVGTTTFGFRLSYYDAILMVGPDIHPYSIYLVPLITY